MSRDIRSFFTVLSKKDSSTPAPSKKKRVIEDSDDEDIIPGTPEQKKSKRIKIAVLSDDSPSPKNKRKNLPDSEDEAKKSKKKPSSKSRKPKEILKPVDPSDLFGSSPVKQSKSKHQTKVEQDFKKTLEQLDDDFPIDIDELDRSIEEKLKNDVKSPEKPSGSVKNKNLVKKELADKAALNNINGSAKEKQSPIKKEAINNKNGSYSSVKEKQSPIKKEPVNTSPNKNKNGSDSAVKEKQSPTKNEDYWNDSTVDPDQERFEKKRHSIVLYKKYLNRSGPVHKGVKEMPKGKPDCLKNLCFLKTGVLDSMEKEDVDAIVKEHGGRTVSAVSKKVNYLIVGEDPGPAKLEKARGFGIKEITEDEFLDMILERSGLPAKYVKQSNGQDLEENLHVETKKKDEEFKEKKEKKLVTHKSPKKASPLKIEAKSPKSHDADKVKKPKLKNLLDPKVDGSVGKKHIKDDKGSKKDLSKEKRSGKNDEFSLKKEEVVKRNKEEEIKVKKDEEVARKKSKDVGVRKEECKLKKFEDLQQFERTPVIISKSNISWTEKHKPSDVKSIIGQQGDKSNMKKLLFWLQNWEKNHSGKNKTKAVKPSPWAKNDDGSYFKCALLSGSPGIGKTTTATLVAKELGYDIVEFNASDTRSKKLLHEEVSQILSSTSVSSFFKDGSAPTKKHVLLMDEVDGMAGNEDRGGIQELINLIKGTNIPIICMCNDRQHPKIRSLVNYCFDLRFVKPRPEQIKGAMMSICFKEGIKISPDALTEVIKSSGGDIRQTLTNLSLWSTNDNSGSEIAAKQSKNAIKDTVLGPWEVIRKVFSEEEHKNMNLRDKSRLFFYDYSIGPLFVQENYLQVVPHCPKKEVLKRLALAADSISMGDVIDKRIRSNNNWSLLDSQAMFSSVLPGYYMEGHFGGQINFPGWLGKNSKRGKFQRLLSELHAHMRTSISGSKLALNLDYIYHLRNNIIQPLASQGTAGVESSLEVMKAYSLLREDFDSILELCQWPKQRDPMIMVESKVKAAFTRAYNKDGIKLPYAINTTAIKKRTAASTQDDIYGEEEEAEMSNDEDDITNDGMIKEKKKPVAKAKKVTAEAGSSRKAEKKPAAKRAKKAK